jgi:hypothetical protein
VQGPELLAHFSYIYTVELDYHWISLEARRPEILTLSMYQVCWQTFPLHKCRTADGVRMLFFRLIIRSSEPNCVLANGQCGRWIQCRFPADTLQWPLDTICSARKHSTPSAVWGNTFWSRLCFTSERCTIYLSTSALHQILLTLSALLDNKFWVVNPEIN